MNSKDEKMDDKSYIYILECSDGSYYTGITKNIKRRMEEHFLKKKNGAKYTKSHQPERVLMVWEANSWTDAASIEYFIKKLKRKQKEEIIKNPDLLMEVYDKRVKITNKKSDKNIKKPIILKTVVKIKFPIEILSILNK